jgi:hypothetical protein
MAIDAVSSSLNGIAQAQARMDADASVTASDGLVDDTGDTVSAVLDAKDAGVQQSVNIAMLRKEMDMQSSIINVLA